MMKKRQKPLKKVKVVDLGPSKPQLALPPAVIEAPAAPPQKSDLWKRMDAAKAKARARRPDITNHTKTVPPLATDDVVGEAVVANKSVAEWAAVVAERTEAGGILDMTDLPAWVTWAVDVWKRRGSPTAASELAKKVTALRAEAEELQKFANMDKSTAADEHKAGNKVKSDKLLAAAAKKSEKAEEKRNEASKLAREWAERKAA
jgi:hypothetical protein